MFVRRSSRIACWEMLSVGSIFPPCSKHGECACHSAGIPVRIRQQASQTLLTIPAQTGLPLSRESGKTNEMLTSLREQFSTAALMAGRRSDRRLGERSKTLECKEGQGRSASDFSELQCQAKTNKSDASRQCAKTPKSRPHYRSQQYPFLAKYSHSSSLLSGW